MKIDAIWKIVITVYHDVRVSNQRPIAMVQSEEQGLRTRPDGGNTVCSSTTMEDDRTEPVRFFDELSFVKDLFSVPTTDDDGDVRERMGVQVRCSIYVEDSVESNPEVWQSEQ